MMSMARCFVGPLVPRITSFNTNMLTVPRFRTKWGSKAFAVVAPSTWNSLPVNLRTASTVTSFKKNAEDFSIQFGFTL